MTAETWNFDPSHSSVGFWVRHLMVSKVHGKLLKWGGTLIVDEADPKSSKVEVEIDAASISTEDQKRDDHLKGSDFLDVAKFPTITFKSTKVEAKSKEKLLVTGDLTVHGVTRPVTLDVELAGKAKDPWGGERAGFSATTTIDRKDFGLGWNVALEAGGVLVGDKLNVQIEIEAVKAKA